MDLKLKMPISKKKNKSHLKAHFKLLELGGVNAKKKQKIKTLIRTWAHTQTYTYHNTHTMQTWSVYNTQYTNIIHMYM